MKSCQAAKSIQQPGETRVMPAAGRTRAAAQIDLMANAFIIFRNASVDRKDKSLKLVKMFECARRAYICLPELRK
jgi:hypothetical protein